LERLAEENDGRGRRPTFQRMLRGDLLQSERRWLDVVGAVLLEVLLGQASGVPPLWIARAPDEG
jgi:hypothetical protein